MPTESIAQNLTVVEVQKLQEQAGTVLLDVRSPGEYETAHIDGAINVPVDRLDTVIPELVAAPPGPMVLLCQSGPRAEQAARKLRGAGRDDLHLLQGGMGAWESAGAPVLRGDRQRWALERQVRLVAGSLVLIAVVLSIWVPPLKWVAGAIGFGLVFAALSNTCMMGMLLSKLPYNRGSSTDVAGDLARLNSR